LCSLEKAQIIFVMLSLFLTGNFSDPLISTGAYFMSFYRQNSQVQEIDKKQRPDEKR